MDLPVDIVDIAREDYRNENGGLADLMFRRSKLSESLNFDSADIQHRGRKGNGLEGTNDGTVTCQFST